MLQNLKVDLDTYAFRKGWPRWFWVFVPFFYTTSWPIITYRFNRWVATSIRIPIVRPCLRALGFIAKRVVETLTTVEISECADIGKGIFIAHLGSIVISHDTKIGKYLSLHQDVTFGNSGREDDYGGPQAGDHLYVGAGAKIIGRVRIGDNVMIGCNAVVTHDVTDHVSVAGVPAKVVNTLGSDGFVPHRPEVGSRKRP